MFRLLVACLVGALLVPSQGSPAGVPPDGVDDEEMLQLRSQFEEFKATYNKEYEGEEEEDHRFQIFVENLKEARRLQEEDRGTAEFGVTKFSDMSDEEFNQFYLNPLMMNDSSWMQKIAELPMAEPMANCSVPRQWDWRKKGAVTRVKNQGKCAACWAFASVANIESVWYLKTKRLVSVSEQELLDCDTYDKACRGGYPFGAFTCAVKLGLMTERRYPYMARRGRCKAQRSRSVVKIKSYRCIYPHEREMKTWVATRGPIVVSLNGVLLKSYRGGILRPNSYNCPCNRLNKVVTIVGYGIQRDIPFWIARNSWGTNWGELGYFRIFNGEKACGLNKLPLTAIA
ncbi:cathepsin F-like isoform X2 [Pristis pectinata]|uniref:cathepsin F-like isoform X2 n=1 Tax=Pristis pectinata TaxID=685728 RepID=UPI00223D8784|nr:cathepsin F-like isoform X2 [Pristis pectinata]